MKNMTNDQRKACHAIIHSASASAGAVGAGLAQIPCSDNMVIAPIQVAMTIALGRVFGLRLSDSAAEAALVSTTGTIIGRTASQVLLGWIPGVGNAINACTATALTESAGWMLAEDFAQQAAYANGEKGRAA